MISFFTNLPLVWTFTNNVLYLDVDGYVRYHEELMRFKIRVKIIGAFLLLTLLVFGILGVLNYFYMLELTSNAVKSGYSTGKAVVDTSMQMMVDLECGKLLNGAESQAYMINQLLERILQDVELLTDFSVEFEKFRGKQSVPANKTDVSFLSRQSTVKFIKGADEKKFAYELMELYAFIPAMMGIIKSTPHVCNVYISFPGGLFAMCPKMKLGDNFVPEKREWHIKALQSDKPVWVGPYVSAVNNKLALACARSVRDDSGRLIAVLGIDLNVDKLCVEMLEVQKYKEGYAFLTDAKGNILAGEILDDRSLRWDVDYKPVNILGVSSESLKAVALNMTSGRKGVDLVNFNNEEYYLAYAPVTLTGWSVGIALPVSEIKNPVVNAGINMEKGALSSMASFRKDVYEKHKIYLLAAVIALVMIVLTGIYVSRRISGPLLFLASEAEKIGKGNLDLHIDIKSGDEIQDLSETLNKMSGDLKLYIRNVQEASAEAGRIENELKTAREIQLSMLPKISEEIKNRPEFDIYAFMTPALEVGGDFYDFFFISEKKFFFCVGDVSGKGIPASLFMAVCKTLIKGAALAGRPPSDILFTVNNALQSDGDSCMFVTIFCAVLDISTGELSFSNAGHNPPLVSLNNAGFKYVKCPAGMALGPMPLEKDTFAEMKMVLAKGNQLFLYTDGVTESVNKELALFSEKRLNDILTGHIHDPPEALALDVLEEIKNFSEGALQADDITILSLRYNG